MSTGQDFRDGRVECRNCSSVLMPRSQRSPSCKLSDVGYFVDKVGASNQTQCKAGTYTDAEGRST